MQSGCDLEVGLADPVTYVMEHVEVVIEPMGADQIVGLVIGHQEVDDGGANQPPLSGIQALGSIGQLVQPSGELLGKAHGQVSSGQCCLGHHVDVGRQPPPQPLQVIGAGRLAEVVVVVDEVAP